MNLVQVSVCSCARFLLLQTHVVYIKRNLLLWRETGFKPTKGKKYLTHNINICSLLF